MKWNSVHCTIELIKKKNFVPRTWSEFFYCESLVFFYLPGVVLWQHIHPSTLHLYWGLTRIQLPKGFLVLRIVVCGKKEFFWYTGIRPGVPKHLYARIRYLQIPLCGNHRLSLLVHLSSLHHHSLGSIHFLFFLVE